MRTIHRHRSCHRCPFPNPPPPPPSGDSREPPRAQANFPYPQTAAIYQSPEMSRATLNAVPQSPVQASPKASPTHTPNEAIVVFNACVIINEDRDQLVLDQIVLHPGKHHLQSERFADVALAFPPLSHPSMTSKPRRKLTAGSTRHTKRTLQTITLKNIALQTKHKS